MADESPPNRGRVQAQGPSTEESMSWPPPNHPPTKREVSEMLAQLWEKLSRAERNEREQCFEDARRWVESRPTNGVDAQPPKTFRNRKLRGGVRVDIEIILGKACVDDVEISETETISEEPQR